MTLSHGTFPRAQDHFSSGLCGVVFDCDGVMIDSTAANREFYNRILAHFGMPPMTEPQATYCCMATSRQALEYLLPEALHPQISNLGRTVVNYDRDILPLVKIFPGFLDFVSFLQEYSIRMAVLTNRTDAGMRSVLDLFGLRPYFNPVVTASCGHPKPEPGGARIILDRWRCEPSQVLYIGDSEVDLRTARAAGLVFASMRGAVRGGDLSIPDYPRLRELIAPLVVSRKGPEIPCS